MSGRRPEAGGRPALAGPRARGRAGLLGLALLTALPIGLAARAARQEAPFPHDDHEGLFPLCTGCHEGIPQGDEADFYPEPELCVGCHDGVDEESVDWSGPHRVPSNLTFRHDEHIAELAQVSEPALACESCHSAEGGPRMTVEPVAAGSDCLSCHVHEAARHYDDADCAVCHVPLARSGFRRERIAALEVPEDHRSGRFIAPLHGEALEAGAARCATCHTRERCLTCHVDGAREEVSRIPPAPPGMELPVYAAHYPVPASHRKPDFTEAHGSLAGGDACATCHAREDCAACHVTPLPAAAAALASRAAVVAPGVQLEGRLPESHQSPFFLRGHGARAASDPSACATCHTEASCVACHEGPGPAQFHPADFAVRHAASGFGQEMECANCHDTQVFCRSCHLQQGFGAEGRLGQGFHDAQPLWLLRHGQAARQSLESCASCHAQGECLQCHAQTGSFRVSPHGPGFDATRAWDRSPSTCFACHLGNPLGDGP